MFTEEIDLMEEAQMIPHRPVTPRRRRQNRLNKRAQRARDAAVAGPADQMADEGQPPRSATRHRPAADRPADNRQRSGSGGGQPPRQPPPSAGPGRSVPPLRKVLAKTVIALAFLALAAAGAWATYKLLGGTLKVSLGGEAQGRWGAILMVSSEITFGELMMLAAMAGLAATATANKLVCFLGAAAMAALVLWCGYTEAGIAQDRLEIVQRDRVHHEIENAQTRHQGVPGATPVAVDFSRSCPPAEYVNRRAALRDCQDRAQQALVQQVKDAAARQAASDASATGALISLAKERTQLEADTPVRMAWIAAISTAVGSAFFLELVGAIFDIPAAVFAALLSALAALRRPAPVRLRVPVRAKPAPVAPTPAPAGFWKRLLHWPLGRRVSAA